jgi:serine/threonine protein phosphatase PrpC
LPRALAGTNDAIAKAAILDGTLEGAGCAFLSAAIDDGALSWTSVGDCSLYLFHGGKLRKLNDDHSMRPVIAASVAAGRVSAKAAAQDPRRNSLRSALKGGEIRLIDNSREPIHLRPGDGVLLASDGLETLSDRTIVKLLRRGSRVAPARIVERLLTAIGASGTRNQDNTTVIFYRFAPSGDVGQGSEISGGRLFLYLVLAAVLLSAVVYGLHISSH